MGNKGSRQIKSEEEKKIEGFTEYLKSQIPFKSFTCSPMPNNYKDYASLDEPFLGEITGQGRDPNMTYEMNPLSKFTYETGGISNLSITTLFGISITIEHCEKMIYSGEKKEIRDSMVDLIEKYWKFFNDEEPNKTNINQCYYYKKIDPETYEYKKGRVYFYYNWRSLLCGDSKKDDNSEKYVITKLRNAISALTLITFKHFFVYVGNNQVIHFAGDNSKGASICKTSLTSLLESTGQGIFAGDDTKHWIYKMQVVTEKGNKKDLYDACIKRAQRLLDYNTKYNPFVKNCEHFAKFCMFGKKSGGLHNQAFEKILEQINKLGFGPLKVIAHFITLIIPVITAVCGPLVDILICMIEFAAMFANLLMQWYRSGCSINPKHIYEMFKNVIRSNIINIFFVVAILAVALSLLLAPEAGVVLIPAGLLLGICWCIMRLLKPHCYRLVHWLGDSKRSFGIPDITKKAQWQSKHLMIHIKEKAEALTEKKFCKAVQETLANMQLSFNEHVLGKKTPEFPEGTTEPVKDFIHQKLKDLANIV